jgi:exosortase/archaeosortase family protein
VTITLTSQARLSKVALKQGSPPVSLFLFLLLTLAAIAADQFFAPALYTSSPLWAVGICAVLVWRRSAMVSGDQPEAAFALSLSRVSLFVVAHFVFVVLALRSNFGAAAGTASTAGWIVATLKLLVLAPTVFLLPSKSWRTVLKTYSPEFGAAVIVLLTFFPFRILDAVWPEYVRVLGHSVFRIAAPFVPGLTYAGLLTPTIAGPHLDLTILPACSGLSGIELFDCLFGFMAVLDWNRLHKGRTALAYFAGIAAMLLGNAVRLALLIILGNRGFASTVARFHVSVGWMIFSVVFLVYLSAVYRLLQKPQPSVAKA